MSYGRRINVEQELGVVVLHDCVTGGEVAQAVEKLFTDDEWQPGYTVLWDARKITKLTMAPKDLAHITALLEELEPQMGPGQSAIVISRKLDLEIALLLKYKRRSHAKRELHIFKRIDEASDWLGVSPDSVAATLQAIRGESGVSSGSN